MLPIQGIDDGWPSSTSDRIQRIEVLLAATEAIDRLSTRPGMIKEGSVKESTNATEEATLATVSTSINKKWKQQSWSKSILEESAMEREEESAVRNRLSAARGDSEAVKPLAMESESHRRRSKRWLAGIGCK